MGLYDESELQLRTALANWDFTDCFPIGYLGDRSIAVVPAYPSDLIDNILGGNSFGKEMKRAVISVRLFDAFDMHRSLGGMLGAGAQTGTIRYGTRTDLAFVVSSWADQQMGGGDTTRKMAGQVEGCFFYNKMRLPALRALRTRFSQEVYDDRAQFWRYDITVEGVAVVSYDS